jgi:hypothetical protein
MSVYIWIIAIRTGLGLHVYQTMAVYSWIMAVYTLDHGCVYVGNRLYSCFLYTSGPYLHTCWTIDLCMSDHPCICFGPCPHFWTMALYMWIIYVYHWIMAAYALDHSSTHFGPWLYPCWTRPIDRGHAFYILAHVYIDVDPCFYTCFTIPVYMLDHVCIHVEPCLYICWTIAIYILDHACIHARPWLNTNWNKAVHMSDYGCVQTMHMCMLD